MVFTNMFIKATFLLTKIGNNHKTPKRETIKLVHSVDILYNL